MGQQCSVLTCRHVDNPDGIAEMSRIDSPDPVMYDLMRKSIQATTAMENNSPAECRDSAGTAAQSGRPSRNQVGQAHLLYRNNSKSSSMRDISPGKKSQASSTRSEKKKMENRAMEGRLGKSGGAAAASTADNNQNDSGQFSSWEAKMNQNETASSTLKCPTRLLIRRRSLRIIEEGGGTHIYAIRYPEDTSKMILSEQAQPSSPAVRQEQCPPRNNKKSSSLVFAAATGAFSSASPVASSTLSNSDAGDDRKNAKTTEPPKSAIDNSSNKTPHKTKNENKHSTSPNDDLPTNTTPLDIPTFLTKSENAREIFSAACMEIPPKRNGTLEPVEGNDSTRVSPFLIFPHAYANHLQSSNG
jgi:hypothetical protein